MKVSILGATGMVGSEVLDLCLGNEGISSVLTIGRRKSGAEHAKLRELVRSDFLDFLALEPELENIKLCIYCLGVYQTQVSKDKF